LATNQEIVLFVYWVDAMVNVEPVCETLIQGEIPDWLAELYQQIE
jgi:hypothetical protein